MVINEIFHSLQGEGSLAGMPGVFIRIAGCPLRCKWCDTKYARPDSAGKEYTVEQVKEAIADFPGRHVVITGGEPMVNPELADFLNDFAEPGMHITIETAGVRYLPELPCDLMSISPKLSNSTPEDPAVAAEHDSRRFDLSAMQQLIDGYNYQLKFVVDTTADLDDIAGCLKELNDVNPDRVYLMPQAVTTAELIAKSRMLAEYCKQSGFSLGQRLQVFLWDNQQGR